ncbi:nitroreductase family protein [Marinospirillum perlucidum]|uniref:nitroreductase family protein n=1 Tax=Marinospirillum perlucidum TaxID=1982602 RepID=UPI000DF2D913|nr:nitroreductase family protein [Marinospirillum perlucidum]
MQTLQALENRFSANYYDANKPLTEQQIEQLVYYASQAPSAFNLQHTRFLAVTDTAAKEQLQKLAFGQKKVSQAAVTFILVADTLAHENYDEVTQQAVEAGLYDEQTAAATLEKVQGNYAGKTQACHDEALRSGSLAAMNLMTAATAMGLVSGPMIGFDQQAVKKAFQLEDRYLPVMLITVGYEGAGNHPKKPRLPVQQLLSLDARPKQPEAS